MINMKIFVYCVVIVTILMSKCSYIATTPSQIIKNKSYHRSLSNISINSSLSHDQYCRNLCHIKFFNHTEERTPPILYSFPGSGNTWTRLLIDYATGIYSGSPYDDPLLIDIFPGEGICNKSVSIIKMHPNINNFVNIHHIQGRPQRRCPSILFEQAILLIRDPYDAIFAEYVRMTMDSHVQSIPRHSFNREKWSHEATAFTREYYNMFRIHYKQLQEVFENEDYMYIRYEDLRNKDIKMIMLHNIVKFLKFKVSDDRLSCAFYLSNSNKIHRISLGDELTKDDVYNSQEIVCGIWHILGYYIHKFDYRPRGYECNATDTEPMVNDVHLHLVQLRLALAKG